jgi:hypothetical protein
MTFSASVETETEFTKIDRSPGRAMTYAASVERGARPRSKTSAVRLCNCCLASFVTTIWLPLQLLSGFLCNCCPPSRLYHKCSTTTNTPADCTRTALKVTAATRPPQSLKYAILIPAEHQEGSGSAPVMGDSTQDSANLTITLSFIANSPRRV